MGWFEMDYQDFRSIFLGKIRKHNCIDDSHWKEVKYINGYAVFMGYLLMGVRGLGILVVIWTTVVLLGGFVSVLEKNDFWCLIGIMLVQTAGVFNFLLKDKLSDILHSSLGLFAAVSAAVVKLKRRRSSKKSQDPSSTQEEEEPSRKRIVLALSFIELLMLAVILCPLAVMYMLGLYISTGVSLWRLIKHDFGNGGGSANLKPALEVLYSLAVAQGVLFGYKKLHAFGAKIGLAELVSKYYSVDKKIVSDYLDNIVEGCEKDPSFATGRNLVTYVVHLMLEPKSKDCFIVGVRALGTIIKNDNEWGHPVLAKHLLTRSASCSHMIQRLLETLGPRSPYSTEIREHAARIVLLIAGSMYLEQFPRGIQCISSLLDTTDLHDLHRGRRHSRLPKEYERDRLLDDDEKGYQIYGRGSPDTPDSESPESNSNLLQGYARLIIQGLRIIQKLIVDEDNRRVIINTEGLLPKITLAPLISDKLHRDHHEEWNSILDESWKLMTNSTGLCTADYSRPALRETGTKPQFEISSNSEAIISTLKSILECSKCNLWSPRRIVVQIVLDQSVDTTSITAPGSRSRRMFIWILLHIFLLPPEGIYAPDDIRILAGEKLQAAMQSSQGEGSTTATGMLQSVRAAFEDLAKAFMDAGNNPDKVQAAGTLNSLCHFYTNEDEYLKELKKAMVDVMPKVLSEILGYGSTREEIIPAATEASNVPFSAAGTDLESGGASRGDGHGNTSSSHQQDGDQQLASHQLLASHQFLQQALIDLCGAIHDRWYREDSDVRTQLDGIATKICLEQEKPDKDFPCLVDEARFPDSRYMLRARYT